MSEVVSFRSGRTEQVASAAADLSGKPITECLAYWASDLRRRGLTAEASYFDAALLTIRDYESAGSKASRGGTRRD